jgi:transcription-repair coupling factor (superfamily II helicase)
MIKDVNLKLGSIHTIKNLVEELTDIGYEKVLTLPCQGEFFAIGDVLKIFPVNFNSFVSINFFGNEIESLIITDKTDSSKQNKLNEIIIAPNKLLLNDGVVIRHGECVVHEDHGVGLFWSLTKKMVDGEDINYVLIRYLNEDSLYVPVNQINKLSKYVGVGRRKPKLNKLGSATWKKTYKKVYENVLQVARELLKIYATREIITKLPRAINREWDAIANDSFGFRTTPDQEQAIMDVYSDLGSEKPMDRLVCGDVGFGKTEVALRAAVQTVANGYQVAILVPTTILAEQHYISFKKRLEGLPIRVARLSRFLSGVEQSEIVKELKSGSVDIIISTHKLIRSDIKFRNLGLLVIDEEQKFGVKDKERLKRLEDKVDVLTITATPIPRTLFMSLSGIRDISLIRTIPGGRKAIETKISPYDKDEINGFIEREIKGGGQVYYLHNDVATIEGAKNILQKNFPDLVISVGHGQLKESDLAKVMTDFAAGKIDILVCSTIIENGLDLPNANTLIVDESDRFGLSQLYQIRGRIGRSKKQAHALFTYRDKNITNNAIKRLKALAENTELGGGYNIALEDLDIRGGGNVLGKEQHGNMETVGVVLYSKLLAEATGRLKKHLF